MASNERVAILHEALARAADARAMATSNVWAEAWDRYEAEVLERLLACEPADDLNRFRLQQAIITARSVRRTIENVGRTEAACEAELDILEGRRLAPVA